MEGSRQFQLDKKIGDTPREQALPDPEKMNWEDLSAILRQAEVSLERLKAAHEVYITTNQEENWRTATPEQKQASDDALAVEQEAYEAYATAAARRNEAMIKMDLYLQEAHKAYRHSTEEEQVLLEKRNRLADTLTNADGTTSLETFRAIAEMDSQLPQLEAACDAAYDRLQKVLDAYTTTITGQTESDEAMAAK
ncbi:MAG: hypothetical protein HY565_03635 [Candidatus Kerfeldbacteria bacterium]|nr:hypothetical protein [Candidatus Kerfeldbacteria bacterium]